MSGESICGWPEPVCCDDCGKSLSGKEVEHGLEGFGHQHRCCDCYEHRMRNGAPRNPTTEPKP